MRTNQEKRYSRVSEGIYRYKSGGFHLPHKLAGRTTSRKLKSIELKSIELQAAGAGQISESAEGACSNSTGQRPDEYTHLAPPVAPGPKGQNPIARSAGPGIVGNENAG
jgi:hypothetical protein